MIPSTSLLATKAEEGSSLSVSITDKAVSGTSNAKYQVVTDGTIKNQNNLTLETWLLTGTLEDVEVKADIISGSSFNAGSSATGTWLPTSSTRNWALTSAPGFAKLTVFTVSIRMAASPFTVLDTAEITLDADNS